MGEGTSTDPAGSVGSLSLGPYDPGVPIVLEVSAPYRDAVWSLWQASIEKSQKRPLRF